MAIFQEKDKNKMTKDGRSWYFSIYEEKIDGTRKKYKSKKYKTKKEAQDAERNHFINNNCSVNNNITTYELIDHYIEHQKDKVKITSYQHYAKYKSFFYNIKDIKINKIDINIITNWQKELSKKDFSVTYKNNINKFLITILRHGRLHFNVDYTNVLNNIKPFKNPNEIKKEMDFYTIDEFKTFISNEDDIKFKAYFKTLYFCGIRKGEANALNWNDIDFDKKILKINKNVSLKIKNEKYVILPPKTKSSNRTIPMCKELYDELKQLFQYYSSYNNFSMDWFVFGGVYPLPDTTVQKKRDSLCNISGIRKIRIHDFRHSCASLLINNGASISLVSKYLGHSNPSITLNTYTHLYKHEFENIINVIDSLK